MSDRNPVSRRTVLTTVTGTGGAVVGLSSGATADSSDDSNPLGVTEAEMRNAIAESEFVLATGSAYETEYNVDSELDIRPSDVPDDAEIYVGEYADADPSDGDPVAVERYETYLERDAPPGFEDEPDRHGGDEFFYVQKDAGTVTIADYEITLGIGAAVAIGGSTAADLEAAVILDSHVTYGSSAVTTSLCRFTAEYDTESFCAGPVNLEHDVIPGGTVDVCGTITWDDVGTDEYEIEIEASPQACVDLCSWFTCPYCRSGTVSDTTPSFERSD